MIPSRLAVIDLGSNTFHLLIVDVDSFGMWQTILKDRRYVKLASGGIDFIDDAAIGRAISVMVEFSERIQGMDVLHTIALGTAALREARNGLDVVERIQTASGIPIELIDGHQEAYYIWKGITSSLPGLYRPCLIMDIGGGSVEFIFTRIHPSIIPRAIKLVLRSYIGPTIFLIPSIRMKSKVSSGGWRMNSPD